MSQNKEVHKEYMRKYRQGSQGGSHHPILDDLVDPIRRKKLEVICDALNRRKGLDSKVFYGIGENGLPMDIVGDLLDATG